VGARRARIEDPFAVAVEPPACGKEVIKVAELLWCVRVADLDTDERFCPSRPRPTAPTRVGQDDRMIGFARGRVGPVSTFCGTCSPRRSLWEVVRSEQRRMKEPSRLGTARLVGPLGE